MGRNWNKAKAGQQWRKQPEGRDDRSYQYWPGSWSVSPRHRNNSADRYDQVQLDQETASKRPSDTRPWRTAGQEVSEQTSVMAAIQKSLTSARKADGKVRRIQEDKKKKQRQWSQWVLEQKAKFAKQRKQYEEDLQRLDQELAETTAQGTAAALRVKEIVLGGAAAIQPQESVPETDVEWERLMAEDMIVETAGFYHAAMQAAKNLDSAPVSAGAENPGGEGAPPTGRPVDASYTHASPAATLRDPYMASPAAGPTAIHRETLGRPPHGSAAHEGLGGSGPPITPTRGTPGPARTPQSTRPTPPPAAPVEVGTGLADRLSAKRSERRGAMAPFGRPLNSKGPKEKLDVEEANHSEERHHETDAAPTGPGPGIIDDDADELDVGMPSPGFGSLE